MQELSSVFNIAILIMSVVIHEVSHGYAAYALGDDTAKRQGRLTMNPLRHLDMYGSIIIPLIFIFSGTGLMFGWAKPVPFNPNNLRDRKRGVIIVAAAGILANLVIAVIFGIFIRLAFFAGFATVPLIDVMSRIVIINIALMLFNLIPIPPIDGSKIFFGFLPWKFRRYVDMVEPYSIILLILFIVFVWNSFAPLIYWLFSLCTGM